MRSRVGWSEERRRIKLFRVPSELDQYIRILRKTESGLMQGIHQSNDVTYLSSSRAACSLK